MTTTKPRNFTRYAWLSIAAAITTIARKLATYFLTNSVGLLSDALESLVNLFTAIVALIALSIAARPADEEYAFGYSKVEYFSSGFEGGMILLAAGIIAATAIPRLFYPQPLEKIGLGLAISVLASLINFAVSRILSRADQRYNSITLVADARHLMTDVITTAGVIVGIILVWLTGWQRLDPIVALLVAANIMFTGIKLLRHSAQGLIDAALPEVQVKGIQDVLQPYSMEGGAIPCPAHAGGSRSGLYLNAHPGARRMDGASRPPPGRGHRKPNTPKIAQCGGLYPCGTGSMTRFPGRTPPWIENNRRDRLS